MKTMRMLIGFLLAFLLYSLPVFASITTAGELRDDCIVANRELNGNINVDDSFKVGLCLGFISGWSQGVDGSEVTIKDTRYVVDIVEEVKVGQMSRVFVKYINEHPEYESKSGDYALVQAMLDAKLIRLIPKTTEQASLH